MITGKVFLSYTYCAMITIMTNATLLPRAVVLNEMVSTTTCGLRRS